MDIKKDLILNLHRQTINRIVSNFKNWSRKNFFGLILFNILFMLMVLLRSAGYFAPYFYITINMIILICIVMTRFFLRLESRFIFLISLVFLLFAAFLKLFTVDFWAERSIIYSFEALVFGVLLYIYETLKSKDVN